MIYSKDVGIFEGNKKSKSISRVLCPQAVSIIYLGVGLHLPSFNLPSKIGRAAL